MLYKLVKGKSKNIALSNMYKELIGKDMMNAHDALADVEATAECYVVLQELLQDKNPDTKYNNNNINNTSSSSKKKVLCNDKPKKVVKNKKADVINVINVINDVDDVDIVDNDIDKKTINKKVKRPNDSIEFGLEKMITKRLF